MKTYVLAAAIAVLCFPAIGFAGAWTSPSGAASSFLWSNGSNDSDVFGSPTNSGDNLYFFHAFSADSNDGSTESVSDTMHVDLTTYPGWKFVSFELSDFFYGDYSISDSGAQGGNSVHTAFSATVTDLGESGPVHPDSPWSGESVFTENTVGGATWHLAPPISINFGESQVTKVHLDLHGEVTAISDGEGGTAAITVGGSFLRIDVTVAPIPEPATLSLLALAGLLVSRRRPGSRRRA